MEMPVEVLFEIIGKLYVRNVLLETQAEMLQAEIDELKKQSELEEKKIEPQP